LRGILTASPAWPPPAFAGFRLLVDAKTFHSLSGVLYLNIGPEICGFDINVAYFGAQHHEVIRRPETPVLEQIERTPAF
jgi:hypothetical protein